MRLRPGGPGRISTAGLIAATLLVALPLLAGGPVTPLAVDNGATGTTDLTPSAASVDAPAGSAPTTSVADADLSLEGYTAAVPRESRPSAPVVSAPGGATPTRLTENSTLCGVGNTQVELLGGDRSVSCVHTFADPVPTRPANKGAIRMDPICYGDGVNGARIQFMYVYAQGSPNRIGEFGPQMLKSWIPAMEGSFRSTSAEQGREIGMRVYMPDCKIEIGVVEMSADDATPDNPGAMRSRIEAAIRNAGFTEENRKYHVWFDGDNDGGACGVAPVYPLDYPGPANPNNVGTLPVSGLAQVAVTFRFGFPIPGAVNPAPGCFGRGAMGATTEIHELLHLLGSVMTSSPNSNGLGHCKDDVDIMCYSEGGVQTYVRCASEFELLDCGSDDYFNARPQVGSYLSTHWNTANSRFLGTSPDDEAYSTLPL